MAALLTSITRLALAIIASVAIMQPVDWCDSCGEMHPQSELTQEVDYGEHYHGELCHSCVEYWLED